MTTVGVHRRVAVGAHRKPVKRRRLLGIPIPIIAGCLAVLATAGVALAIVLARGQITGRVTVKDPGKVTWMSAQVGGKTGDGVSCTVDTGNGEALSISLSGFANGTCQIKTTLEIDGTEPITFNGMTVTGTPVDGGTPINIPTTIDTGTIGGASTLTPGASVQQNTIQNLWFTIKVPDTPGIEYNITGTADFEVSAS